MSGVSKKSGGVPVARALKKFSGTPVALQWLVRRKIQWRSSGWRIQKINSACKTNFIIRILLTKMENKPLHEDSPSSKTAGTPDKNPVARQCLA